MTAAADSNLAALMEHLRRLRDRRFTGSVTIHFSQGGIGRIEQTEVVTPAKPARA
jgi:hypothetical protein